MDSNIVAALIGGGTTVIAAVITTIYAKHRDKENSRFETRPFQRSRDRLMVSTLLAVLMIVGGLCLTFGGIIVLLRRQPGSPVTGRLSAASTTDSPDAPIRHNQPMPPSGKATKRPDPLDSQEKGIEFEKWVVAHLHRGFYTIKEWRGDKYVEGNYAETSSNPDLEVEFHMREIRKPFAIECKWRHDYEQGEKPYVDWASDRQIENYRGFAKARNMPVFVVIGIGGAPNDPAEVFVVPLNSLRYPKATAEYLA
ncbi:MAG: hypothetical protein ACHRXM_18930 [Isosphaerales bacterium]